MTKFCIAYIILQYIFYTWYKYFTSEILNYNLHSFSPGKKSEYNNKLKHQGT